MECPHCHGPFNDPTTFPCGHSCCLEEAMKLPHCCVCESRFNHKQLRVNYFMRDILANLQTKTEDSSDKELLPLLECPICFIPYIDPTTFPCGHSVCLEEAKELRSCPICNGRVPETLSLNASMRALISHLCSYSADKELSLQVTSLTLDTQEVLEEVKDCNEAVEGEGAVGVTEAMKKKRKSKKKKPKVTIELLADLYYDAKFKIDFKAMERIEQIAASNHMLAIGFCGILYTEGSFFNRGNSEQLAKKVLPWLLTTFTDTKDKYLQFLIGMLHYTLLQHIAGLQYLKLSANQGYGAAQYSLGIMLNAIHGNHSQCIAWLRKAAEQRIAMANRKLGYLLEGVEETQAESFKYYKLAADQGDVIAQFSVGTIYMFGKGVSVDYALGAKYYKLAADQGDAAAQYNLGCAYMQGDGVPVDNEQCVKYLHMSAEQNFAEACLLLGSIYDKRRDFITAAKYTKICADQGNADAQLSFGVMLHHGRGVATDEALAFHYFKLAADQGKAEAQVNVVVAYKKGSAVPQCLNESFRYAKMAADQCLLEAYKHVSVCYINGKGVRRDAREGVKYLK